MTNKDDTQGWIVMHCLNAYKDEHGNDGEHKVPVEGYDTPMTKIDALSALQEIETTRPNEDFSIRRVPKVAPFQR